MTTFAWGFRGILASYQSRNLSPLFPKPIGRSYFYVNRSTSASLRPPTRRCRLKKKTNDGSGAFGGSVRLCAARRGARNVGPVFEPRPVKRVSASGRTMAESPPISRRCAPVPPTGEAGKAFLLRLYLLLEQTLFLWLCRRDIVQNLGKSNE